MARQDDIYTAAVAELAQCPPAGSRWRHRSGGEYLVVCACLIEESLTPAVAYRPMAESGPAWVRPLDEFLDGRFTQLSADGEPL
jgi:hypothetical protein